MKKQLLLLLACITALFSYSQTTESDLETRNLKGKVKSVNETEYDGIEKFGEMEKKTKTNRFYLEFNNAGFEVQLVHESFDDDEKEKFVRTTRYENNKVIEMKEDDNGNVQLQKYKYNQQGLLESIDLVDKKGNLLYRQKNKYKADGLLAQADAYKGDGSQEVKTEYSYNTKKQLIKEERYDKDSKMAKLYTYAYDSNGEVVEKSSMDYARKEKNPYILKYAYNDKGQKIEERNSISGLDKKEIYEYNVQGDEVRKLDEYGDEEKKVYTYDAQNNWIKCVTTRTSNGEAVHKITERQIKYY